jgi:hypothetical protein
MYSKVQARLKTENGYTESFPISVGTRQGCNLSPSLFNCFINDIPEMLDNINANQPSLCDKKISCLMYADDLVLMSKSSQGLSKLLKGVENYCNKWQLTVNTDKTKVLVARKRKTDLNSWYIYGKKIEVVKSFCYLGFEIDDKGCLKKAIERLHSKACAAYQSVRESFNFMNGTPVTVLCKLFESMTQSVALYGCELWGIYGWRTNNIECITNYLLSSKHKFEKLHSRFCKQVMGIDRSTPDLLAKAELGRYLLMSTIVKLSYNYWQHILGSDESSLVYQALKENVSWDKKGVDSYYTRIKCLLSVLKAKDKIYCVDEKTRKFNSKIILEKYCQLYEDFFFQQLSEKSNRSSEGKFMMYCKLKKYYKKESYLLFIHNNILRRNISGIRCASNLFPINYLRKFGIKREARFCTMCEKQALGTELHVAMYCENVHLKRIQEQMFNLLYEYSWQFKKLNREQMFYYLVQGIEEKATLYFAIFLNKVYGLLKANKSVVQPTF